MGPPDARRPASALAENGPSESGRLGGATEFLITRITARHQEALPERSARRQRQARHLHRCGPRCILEALLAVDRGDSLDAVLADFERLPPETYHAALMLFCDGAAT